MNNVASKPRTSAIVALATVASLTVFAVVFVPDVEAAQEEARASEREIERVYEELEAQASQLRAQLEEFEVGRELDLEALIAEAVEVAGQRFGGVRAVGRRDCGLFGERVLDHADDLGLTDDQVEQIRAAQRGGRRDSIDRRADIDVAEMDLEVLYEASEPDLGAIRAKLEELAMLQVDHQIASLTLRQQVRGILAPSQIEDWDDMSGESDVRVIVSGSWSSGAWSNFGHFGC